ncbi:MAG TPA: hypothetical protein VL326_20070 [Kofleriaceae bacterium]|nr:hypothetical protein [Kofleriaceae bacterium]
MKLLAVVAAVAALTSVASADTATTAAKDDAKDDFDENADATAREANLEPNGQREGVMFGGALGGGVMIGGGVGRGPVVDFRLGHQATMRTQITFELVISSSLHKEAMMSKTLTDSVAGLFVGAQRYTASRSSVWIRGSGGLAFYQADFGKDNPPKPITGVGGLVGGGIDLFRWGKVVLGFEAFTVGSISRDGFKLDLNFCTNLVFY